jgi:lysophospholipase L1-like esterase
MGFRSSLLGVLEKLGLALLVSVLVLAVSEAGLRAVYPKGVVSPLPTDELWPWIRYDPILGWSNAPDYETKWFRIGPRKFRDSLIEPGNAEGSLRVICAGDSRTFGIWLNRSVFNYDNDYPRLLEERLRSETKGRPVEVINAGVIGYNSAHGLRQLKTTLLAFHPDILVVAFGLNDQLLSWNPALRVSEPRGAFARGLLYRLSGARLLQIALFAYQRLPWFHPPPFSVPWVTSEEYAYNLRRIAEVSREADIRLVFLRLGLRPLEMGESLPGIANAGPVNYRFHGVDSLEELHEVNESYDRILRRVAIDEKVPVADARNLPVEAEGTPRWGSYDKFHYTAAGAKVVAETVYERLVDLGWLQGH